MPDRGPAWGALPLVTAGIGLLAALSALVLPSVPSFDPWAWIVWGREIDTHLRFATFGGPSWKPLPVAFTTVFGLFGGAAPGLWMVTVRAGGLLALFGAYRLGSRLAGWAAGAVAAAGLLLTTHWLRFVERGASEPLVVGLLLWAILAHLGSRRRTAFMLTLAASLARPEVWPFLGLYAIWLWRADASRVRWLIVGGLALLPLLWFVAPWIGSDDPFTASNHAATFNGHLGSDPPLEVLRRGGALVASPLLLGALVAAVLALRRRQRLTLWLAGASIAWVGVVVAMALVGYPGLARFMLPAAALVCVLGGAGLVRVVRFVRRRPIAIVLALVLAGGTIAGSLSRLGELRAQYAEARDAEHEFASLDQAVKAAGGPRLVVRCAGGLVAVNHFSLTALAWTLGIELRAVRPFLRHPGITFQAPNLASIGGPPELSYRPRRVYEIAQVGVWHVFGALPPGERPAPGCPHRP